MATAGWLPISTAPKDGTEIWAYTNEGCQRVVHWEAEHPGAPDDPGHDAGWMSDDGSTYPSFFYHKPQPPIDPPLRWRPLPEAPAPSQEGASEGEGEDTSGAVAPPFDKGQSAPPASDVVAEARGHLSLWGDRTMRGEDIAIVRALIAEVERLRAALARQSGGFRP